MSKGALAKLLATDKAFRKRMYDAGRLRVQRTRLYALNHNDQWIHVASTERPKARKPRP